MARTRRAVEKEAKTALERSMEKGNGWENKTSDWNWEDSGWQKGAEKQPDEGAADKQPSEQEAEAPNKKKKK